MTSARAMPLLAVRWPISSLILALCATLGSGPSSAAINLWDDSPIATRGVPEKLYHYGFSRNADSILKEGLQPGIGIGKVFTTPSGGLSPLLAQIDLALPPNRGLSNALFEIDASALRRMGVEIPSAQPVGRSFNMPGGRSEVTFGHPIPPEVIRRIR